MNWRIAWVAEPSPPTAVTVGRLSRKITGEVRSGTRYPNWGEVGSIRMRKSGGGGGRLLWWLGRCGRSDRGGRLRICGRRRGDRGRLRRGLLSAPRDICVGGSFLRGRLGRVE